MTKKLKSSELAPALQELRLLWTNARDDAEGARAALLERILKYSSVDQFGRALSDLKRPPKTKVHKSRKIEPAREPSTWERASEKLGASKTIRSVSGGLPSLGKKAR